VPHILTRMARGERGLIVPEPTRRRMWRDTSAVAAARIGMSVETYRANQDAGLKWCSGHSDWHPLSSTKFPTNRARSDSLDGNCAAWHREYSAARRATS
jgi:hypothetical protein